MADFSDFEVRLISGMARRQLTNAGIAAIVLLVAYGFLEWNIFLLLGLVALAIALTGLLTLFGILGRGRLPLIQLALLVGSAFVLLEPGVWRWVFVAVGVFLGLAVLSRKGSPF